MLTRMPPWHGRAATLRDGRRVGAMRMPDDFAFVAPDLFDTVEADGKFMTICIGHGGNVKGPKGAHLVCDAGYFFAVVGDVTYDDEARAALKDNPAGLAALESHLAAHPVDSDDLVALEA